MAYVNLNPTTKNSRGAAIITALGTASQLLIYTGAYPTDPSISATGTLLGTLNCSATFGTMNGTGTLTANAITQANATASGTAGWARLQTGAGVGIVDMDVGTSGASLNLNTVNLVASGPIQVTSLTLTEA